MGKRYTFSYQTHFKVNLLFLIFLEKKQLKSRNCFFSGSQALKKIKKKKQNPFKTFTLPFQLILSNLLQAQKEIEELSAKGKEIPQDAELEQLLIQLKEKIYILIKRANQGITLITVIYQQTK